MPKCMSYHKAIVNILKYCKSCIMKELKNCCFRRHETYRDKWA